MLFFHAAARLYLGLNVRTDQTLIHFLPNSSILGKPIFGLQLQCVKCNASHVYSQLDIYLHCQEGTQSNFIDFITWNLLGEKFFLGYS